MPPGEFADYDDVRALTDILKLKPVHVVGVSFGGSNPSPRIEKFWDEEEAALDKGDLEAAERFSFPEPRVC